MAAWAGGRTAVRPISSNEMDLEEGKFRVSRALGLGVSFRAVILDKLDLLLLGKFAIFSFKVLVRWSCLLSILIFWGWSEFLMGRDII